MKIDIYHLYPRFTHLNFVYPIVLDVLKVWSESIGWSVRISVCKESEVKLSTDADVVAISVYTPTAPAAYRLGEKLRQKGKVVILGGPHFRNSNHEEALSHCDFVVESIGEEQWKDLLCDIQGGRIPPDRQGALYIKDLKCTFQYPDNMNEMFRFHKWHQVTAIPTSLGCPYDCEFCGPYMPGSYVLRDIETVYNDMSAVPGKYAFICDASFGLNRNYTIELMGALAKLKKTIGVETTLKRMRDREIMDAMSAGGVKWISVGIESLSMKFDKLGEDDIETSIKRAVDEAHERGILVQGNIIIGLDGDGPESFERIYSLYDSSDIDSLVPIILTPYPNTKLYKRLYMEERILDTNWEHYDRTHIVYRPKKMTIDEFIDGYIELNRNIFNVQTVFDKARHIYTTGGLTSKAVTIFALDVLTKYGARKVARELRSKYEQLVLSGGTAKGTAH